MERYHWRTDAASGELDAGSVDEALDALVAQGEWPTPSREQHYLDDGAWLLMFDADGCEVSRIGRVP